MGGGVKKALNLHGNICVFMLIHESTKICTFHVLIFSSSFYPQLYNKYRIYHVYEEYKRRYTPLDGLPEAIAEGKQPSGVYRVYTPSRRGISGLYNI